MSEWRQSEWGDYELFLGDGSLVVREGPEAARRLVKYCMVGRVRQLPWWRRIAARVAFGREFD